MREMAEDKVEMDGEPRARWVYATNSASGRLRMEKKAECERRERAEWGEGGGNWRFHRLSEGDLVPVRKGTGED